MAKVLRRFFREQNQRILALLGPSLDTITLDLRFNADDEAALMLAEIEPLLLSMAATGAAVVVQQADEMSTAKAFSFGKFKLPKSVVGAIESTFDKLGKASYWRKIQSNVKESVTDAIKSYLVGDGLSIPNMTKRLRTLLGGASKTRAETIARTEVTGAMNSGHQAGYNYLADEGILEFKQWLSILDKRCRDTHVAANGQYARAKGSFTVGGYRTPYPGWPSLPPQERCRCRCTVIAVFGPEATAAAESQIAERGEDEDADEADADA
jgi:hypothetical protein